MSPASLSLLALPLFVAQSSQPARPEIVDWSSVVSSVISAVIIGVIAGLLGTYLGQKLLSRAVSDLAARAEKLGRDLESLEKSHENLRLERLRQQVCCNERFARQGQIVGVISDLGSIQRGLEERVDLVRHDNAQSHGELHEKINEVAKAVAALGGRMDAAMKHGRSQ
ncbi:MAG: hypothetical protein ACE15C_14570 [Phycisphaerae bacterium]